MSRQAIRDQVSIEDALEMLDLPAPDGAGKICCPFHEENTPSCHVYDDHFHCYGCGANGDVLWFVAKVTGAPLWKAEQFLLGGVDLDAEVVPRPKLEPPPVDMDAIWRETCEYTAGPMVRKLAEDFIAERWPTVNLEYLEEMFKVRVTKQGLAIPHFHGEKVTGIKVRYFTGSKTSVKGSKYTWPYDGELPVPFLHDSSIVLCEGESDTWCMNRHRYAVGLPSGVGSYTDKVHEYLTRFKDVYLALDNDEPGRRASGEIHLKLTRAGVRAWDLSPQFGANKDVALALASGWKPDFR